MVNLLFILALSYWYCLPVITTEAFGGYNEFRGYDFILLILLGVMLGQHSGKLRALFRNDPPGKWLYRFCLLATAMTPLTLFLNIMAGKMSYVGGVVIYLFHLWGFVIAYAALRIFVKTRKQCLKMLDTFLAVGLVEALIICLQSVGTLPSFWNSHYDVYGERAFSGILGMNRTLPGHVMILVYAVAFAYFQNRRVVGTKRFGLAVAAAVLALAGLAVSGSRTAWLVFCVLLLFSLVSWRLALPTLGLVLFAVILLSVVAPTSLQNEAKEMFNYRVTGRLEVAASDDAMDKFRSVDARRSRIWMEGVQMLLAKPYLLVVGSGFANYRFLSWAQSAHNIYITLLAEMGVAGLAVYLMWLRSMWQESSCLMRASSKGSSRVRPVFHATTMRPLLASMIVSLLAGEILYIYRPSFAFLGMFLFLCAILNHRALVFGGQIDHSNGLHMTTAGRTKRALASWPRLRRRVASGDVVNRGSSLIPRRRKDFVAPHKNSW